LRRKVAGRKRKTARAAAAFRGRCRAQWGDGLAGDGLGNCRIFVIMADH
jgi:hypothetical protein